jgi:superfamily II RNA helicase
VKKVLAKGMKASGGKGPNTGGGQSVQGKKKSNFEKTLLAVQKMNLLPSIVFTFSRAGTF